jgi:hypothetical protein
MPKGPQGQKRLPDWVSSELTFLFGAALCFGLAWLHLAAHHWQLGMSLIPFGAVLILVGALAYRDRTRNAKGLRGVDAIDLARELECDEDEDAFKVAVRKIGTAPREPKAAKPSSKDGEG